MCRKYVLISIKPQYATQIKKGNKTVELRKVVPKVCKGDTIVIYESAPIWKITSYFKVEEIITTAPEILWQLVGEQTMVSKDTFDNYFKGRTLANGIRIGEIVSLKNPKKLGVIKKKYAPQSYYYITKEEFYKINNENWVYKVNDSVVPLINWIKYERRYNWH